MNATKYVCMDGSRQNKIRTEEDLKFKLKKKRVQKFY